MIDEQKYMLATASVALAAAIFIAAITPALLTIQPQQAQAKSCNQQDPTCHGCAEGSQGSISSEGRCFHPAGTLGTSQPQGGPQQPQSQPEQPQSQPEQPQSQPEQPQSQSQTATGSAEGTEGQGKELTD